MKPRGYFRATKHVAMQALAEAVMIRITVQKLFLAE